ncbi:Uncharacterized conserved protein [Streptococcus henryi]|uniref:Uncharacterized conserved protein n=1 Tax=Streptococcus henryi TaxID=439219 RepID=A0A1G6ARL2_9STRE|nr:GFA family protein [Streptococcus henryi]SDB10823.1 Uncharacterized conserved protein [Streptococcus henryi]
MLRGSCLCKAVTYQTDQEIAELVFCHCSFCRKATASGFSVNARIKREKLQLLTGEDRLVIYSSSPGKDRYYCSTCHSQIFHRQEELPDLLTLKMGTVDTSEQDMAQVPKRHIFQDQHFNWLNSQ